MTERRVYLDYNATTPLHEAVKAQMIKDFEIYGNASSMHAAGREARARVEASRRAVAELLGAESADIVFTSGGSESNNTVFATMREFVETGRNEGRSEIIVSAIEHPCILASAEHFRSPERKVIVIPVDRDGKIKLDALKAALSDRTLLVSIMYANNEIGVIQDLPTICRLAKEAGAFMHTDAVQAAGKIPIDVKALGLDYLTMSAHKIYGPKGAGALYRKRGAPLSPLVHGGHQESGLRAGTYNNIGILGLGKAAELALSELDTNSKKFRALRERLRDGLLKKVPDIIINGHATDVLPNTLNVSFPGAEGEAILLSLDLKGIEVSTGSACASGSLDPSHVLMAIGVSSEAAHGSMRMSVGRGTSEDDIDYVLEVLPPVIARLRAMSTAH